MNNIIDIIHNIINKVKITSNNYVFLDNNNTMNYYYDNKLYNIYIFHNLNYLNILFMINELKKYITIKIDIFFDNYSNITFTYENQNTYIIKGDINNNCNQFYNIYLNLITLDYCFNNNSIIIHDNYNLYDKCYISKDIFNLINLISFYIKNNKKLNDDIKIKIDKMINNTIKMLENNLFKILIKKKFNEDYNNNLNKLLILIKELEINNTQYLSDIIKYDIINYIVYDINKINTFNIQINNIEEYFILILIEKLEIVNANILMNLNDEEPDNNNLFFLLNKDINNDFKNIKEIFNFYKELNNTVHNLKVIDIFKIKIYVHIIYILFYEHLTLNIKMAYIYKIYQNIDINILKDVFIFYNKIVKYLKFDNFISDDNFIFMMLVNNNIKQFEINKILNIPTIHKQFNQHIDTISIIDYQNAIITLYEYIYTFKIDDDNLNDNIFLDELFDSILCTIRCSIESEKQLLNLKKSTNLNSKKKSYNLITDNMNDSNELIYDIYNSFNDVTIINQSDNRNDIYNNEINEIDDNALFYTNMQTEYDSETSNDEINEDINDNISNKDIKYKIKYNNMKNDYLKLKLVKEFLLKPDFDIKILYKYNELTNELINEIINK